MSCRPEILLHRNSGKPKISVILIDWGVRESFHCLDYLNRQTVGRGEYELIWLEFYDRKPEVLQQLVAGDPPLLDQWYVLGYPDDFIFHKHRLYNAGILAATGEVCVICDSDALFRPTFIENLIRAFEETPDAVIHLDEVRNNDRRFYPFNYPRVEEILGPGCLNWQGETTTGLSAGRDIIHGANYGACMAARRRDLLAVGGADEHLDYLGYVCGPYELTFRLVNYYGRQERWLRNEYLYHTWHPNTSGINADYHGPHDGRFMSLRSLDARASYRVKPYLKNPLMGRGQTPRIEDYLECLRTTAVPAWKSGAQPTELLDEVYWVERDHQGFNIFAHAGRWYAVPECVKAFEPKKTRTGSYALLLEADTFEELQTQIDAQEATPRGRLDRIRRSLFAQPLHRLPMRAWRKSRRLVTSLLPVPPPWQPSARTQGDPRVEVPTRGAS